MPNPLVFPQPTVDGRAFIDANARLAGAAAIVTWHGDSHGGMLVRAVSLLSTRPPRVLFGVDKKDPGHADLLQAQTFAINLLSDADEEEAERFSRNAAAQTDFPSDRWLAPADQPPRLVASPLHLLGFVDHRIDAGSHSLILLRVSSSETTDGAPLVCFDHGFRRLAQPGSAMAQIAHSSEAPA